MLLLGDFNKHHALWAGPNHSLRCNRSDTEDFIDLLVTHDLSLCMAPGTPTFTSPSHKTTSTIDLVFASGDTLLSYVSRCESSDSEGTWHRSTRVELEIPMQRNLQYPKLDICNADWDTFKQKISTELANHNIQEKLQNVLSEAALDETTTELIDLTKQALKEAAEESRPTKYSKRWWTRGLTNLRKHFNRCQRHWFLLSASSIETHYPSH